MEFFAQFKLNNVLLVTFYNSYFFLFTIKKADAESRNL